ncbi:MAG: F0F1 ATP synthase subunit epsilon [Sedimentisphaerales bacterium]
MSNGEKNFRCVIVSPAGRLLDCQSIEVTFIAHDGSRGILYNHMPMLCELGLGIMEIKLPGAELEENNNGNTKLALIDGGFALVSSNMINIIATEAVCQGQTREKIEHLLERGQKRLSKLPSSSLQYQHETRKNTLLKKILEES